MTHKLDIFAFGWVMIEMFSRQRPVSPREGGPALPTEEHLVRIAPPALRELVRKCMAVDPTQRSSSMDMVEAMWDGKIFYDVPAQGPAAAQCEGFLQLFLPYRRTAAGGLELLSSCREPPEAPGQASA
jgi:serine/threonine protein kinase